MLCTNPWCKIYLQNIKCSEQMILVYSVIITLFSKGRLTTVINFRIKSQTYMKFEYVYKITCFQDNMIKVVLVTDSLIPDAQRNGIELNWCYDDIHSDT